MQIITTAGHYSAKPGATHEGFSEWPETAKWAGLIAQNLIDLGVKATMVAGGNLSGKATTVNNLCSSYDGDSLFVSVHFNSYSGEKLVNGSETLYCPGSKKGEKLAKYVQETLADVMGNNDRGIKEGWYQMNKAKGVDYILKHTACPAIIIEPEFIQQRETIEGKREEACMAIAAALSTFTFESKGVTAVIEESKKGKKKRSRKG